MRSIISILFVLGVTVPLAASQACSPYSPDLGSVPFLCGSADPKCPDGYTCQSGGSADVCVGSGGTIPDAGHGSCANDSNVEPNDTIQTAWMTPVGVSPFTLAGLAICPAGDKDNYSINIPNEGTNIEVIVVYEAAGAPLTVSILGGTGTAIAMGSPVSGQTDTIRAYVASLPAGTYYALVTGPTTGTVTTNNYKMTITTN